MSILEKILLPYGVGVGNRGGGEPAVVSAWPPRAVSFSHHVQGGWPRALQSPDYPCLLQLRKLCLGCLELLCVQLPDRRGDRWAAGMQVVQYPVVGLGELGGRVEHVLAASMAS